MLKFLRILIGAVFVVPILIITYPLCGLVFLFRKWGKESAASSLLYGSLYFIAWWIMFFFGGNVHFVNKENIPSAPALVLPLHLRCSFVGKIEIKKLPIINSWFRALDAVYIDRKNPRQSLKAIIDGSRMIECGVPMSIFPEGTRSRDGRIHEFNFKGTRTLFEDGYSLLRRPVYIQFLPHINTEGMSEEELHGLPEKVQNMIQEAYDRLPPIKGLKVKAHEAEA